MKKEKNEFILTHEGIEVFRGTEEACYVKLQRSQSHSADWAMKYERWDVKEINPVFYKAWSDTDFANVKEAIVKHFRNRIFVTHKGIIKFGKSFKAIDEVLGLAYTSSSSIAMYGICNIHVKESGESEFYYNHFAVSELTGNVFAELWDKDENIKLIQLTK